MMEEFYMRQMMRSHTIRSRTPWDWRLKLYPFIVIPWIFYVAAGGSLTPSRTPEASGGHSAAAPFNVAAQTSPSVAPSGSEFGSTDGPASAAPQTAAFPDRTCWVDSYPLESFCFVLTEERK